MQDPRPLRPADCAEPRHQTQTQVLGEGLAALPGLRHEQAPSPRPRALLPLLLPPRQPIRMMLAIRCFLHFLIDLVLDHLLFAVLCVLAWWFWPENPIYAAAL